MYNYEVTQQGRDGRSVPGSSHTKWSGTDGHTMSSCSPLLPSRPISFPTIAFSTAWGREREGGGGGETECVRENVCVCVGGGGARGERGGMK